MARDPLHTREQPIPHTGEQPIPNIGKGQGGRSRWRRGHGGTLTTYLRN